jgi:YfiH family protein
VPAAGPNAVPAAGPNAVPAAGPNAVPAEWTLAGGIRVRSTGWTQGDLGGGPAWAAGANAVPAAGANAVPAAGPNAVPAACPNAVIDRRRRAVVDLPWTVLRQVHGSRVVVVERPGAAAGEAADGAVTTASGAAVAVLTADCAPVALGSPEGVVGVAHAGWRGLRAGVVEATVQAMRRLGATRVEAVIGPCIHPCCYTFGEDDLAAVEERWGSQVRAIDRLGRSALDLPAGVRAALHSAGATLVGEADDCTCCSEGFWSWRANQTTRRQATVAWRP